MTATTWSAESTGKADIEVKLLTDVTFYPPTWQVVALRGKLRTSKTAATTMTANNGFYSFTGLDNKTKYWVQVTAGSDAGGYTGLSHTNPNLAGGAGGFDAQTYPPLPAEGSYAKPTWNRATGVADGTDVDYTVGEGNAAQTATFRNFGLVYTNGTVAGRVNNVSGSNGNIDVRVTTNTDSDALWERATSLSGEFSVANVLEGMYTAVIEDAGFAAPCMNAAGTMPDDDGPLNDTIDGTPVCVRAMEELNGTVEGRADYQSIGILHVYSSTMGAVDMLDSLVVTQTVGGVVDTLGTAATSITQSTDGSGTTAVSEPTGNIAYATARVRVVAHTDACPARKP